MCPQLRKGQFQTVPSARKPEHPAGASPRRGVGGLPDFLVLSLPLESPVALAPILLCPGRGEPTTLFLPRYSGLGLTLPGVPGLNLCHPDFKLGGFVPEGVGARPRALVDGL